MKEENNDKISLSKLDTKTSGNQSVSGTHAKTGNSNRKGVYILGGTAAMMFVLVALLDIISSIISGKAVVPGTLNTVDWFTLFQQNPFHAFQNLGLFNIVEQSLMIPVFFALFLAHKNISKYYAAISMILNFIGAAIYISNNAAIPLFVLSSKYVAATTDAQRSVLLSAGQAILARGEDFTPGTFMGFFFLGLAGIAISFIMMHSGVFSKTSSYLGILGTSILFIFSIWATFVPASYNSALILAMFGGLLSMVWLILISRRLFQLASCRAIDILIRRGIDENFSCL
ncbi:MAG: DUF4386 family protein [Bacillota bacterium]